MAESQPIAAAEDRSPKHFLELTVPELLKLRETIEYEQGEIMDEVSSKWWLGTTARLRELTGDQDI